MEPEFNVGGVDFAKRTDLSAFIALKWKNGTLTQIGQKTWSRINYKKQADDLLLIQRKIKCNKICYDRTGVGDAAIELFSKEIPMEEVISSMPTKIKIINLIHALFQNNRLIIKDKELYKQVLEQEKHISDAGNELYRHPSGRHDDLFWALGYACYAAKDHLGGVQKVSIGVGKKIEPQNTNKRINKMIESTFGSGYTIYSYR